MTFGRSALLAVAAGLFIWLTGSAVTGGEAKAQGCGTSSCNPKPPCCAPPAPPPKPPGNPCCGGGGNHNVNVPGINVYVAPSVIVNAKASAYVDNSIAINAENNAKAYGSASASAYAGAYAGAVGNAGATGYGIGMGGGCCGGGGQQFYSPPMATGMIQGMMIDGGQVQKVRRVAYEATRTRTRRVVIQAFCLDDRQVPHPASQVTPDREIDDLYDGELYRCLAGTRMQYTVAEYSGRISFAGGETVVCGKNESLYHVPGGRGGLAGGPNGEGAQGGASVVCRPQKAARDCNERSLLRRFGAGVKILTMASIERYTAYRDETYMEAAGQTVMTTMSLDGGVGGVAF